MARLFLLYGRKRGDRRIGSPVLASISEALFFAFFLLLGAAVLAWIAWAWILPEWSVHHGFVKTTCQVLGKSVDGEIGRRIKEQGEGDQTTFRPDVRIKYSANGAVHENWTYDITNDYLPRREDAEAALARFTEGNQYACWYDPLNPNRVVLVRGLSWWIWIAMFVPISFMAIGGGGLVYTMFDWGKSTEHRSAAGNRVAALNPWPAVHRAGGAFPYVPSAANLTDSPGTTLAFRLPTSASPGWRMFALGAAAVTWNIAVIVMFVVYLTGAIEARPAWPFWLLLGIAVPVGGGLAYLFAREVVLTSGVAPTLVEISDHPVVPGSAFDVFLSQSGKLSLRSLELSVVCEEEATYRQGTDTRTESRCTFRERLWGRESFDVEQGLSFEVRCPLQLPGDAMHSFKAGFNEVQWKLVVSGQAEGWAPFQRVFPIVVYPRRETPA